MLDEWEERDGLKPTIDPAKLKRKHVLKKKRMVMISVTVPLLTSYERSFGSSIWRGVLTDVRNAQMGLIVYELGLDFIPPTKHCMVAWSCVINFLEI